MVIETRENIILKVQNWLRLVPVMVIGSGASAKYGIPTMAILKDYLLKEIQPTTQDTQSWEKFKTSIEETLDLELSLQRITLPDSLSDVIVKKTYDLINSADSNVFFKMATDYNFHCMSSLIRYLFNSTHNRISIITTNYDRLLEYATDAAGFSHYTGFNDGYIRFLSSSTARGRVVNIWKMHGSLDWHIDEKDNIISFPFLNALPPQFKPLIVTPGIRKYELTHAQPYRAIFQNADSAIDEAPSFLVWGYGFRDKHIQAKLVERVYRDNRPIIVLARTLTPEAKEFLFDPRCKNFVAIEKNENGSKAYSEANHEGIALEKEDLWDLESMLEEVL